MAKKKVMVVSSGFGIGKMFKDSEDFEVSYDSATKPDLVVFTGGADINPQLYGESPIPGTHFTQSRDDQDLEAFKKYTKVPKVGICRGGQFLNVMSGGSMWQDVNNHAVGRGHYIYNLLRIPGIEEQKLMVTSTHHQMMIAGDEGEVIAIAKSHDYGDKGIATYYKSANKEKEPPKFDTEVVWYPYTNSLCYQPHPEYELYPENKEYFFKLLNHFFF